MYIRKDDMTTISTDPEHLTLINTFVVAPQRADELMELLIAATDDTMRHIPGFVSANLHINDDRTRIVNYAQWKSAAAFDAMLERNDAKPHMAAAAEIAESFEPITYSVVHVEATS